MGYPTQHAIGDANALVRPAKLRGLPPDSTLMLISGERRHHSSAISIFTFGDDFTERHQDSDSQPIYAHARALLGVEASYTFRNSLTLAAGVDNLFDTYPTKNPYARDYGQKYPVASPYGCNGGFHYFRESSRILRQSAAPVTLNARRRRCSLGCPVSSAGDGSTPRGCLRKETVGGTPY